MRSTICEGGASEFRGKEEVIFNLSFKRKEKREKKKDVVRCRSLSICSRAEKT